MKKYYVIINGKYKKKKQKVILTDDKKVAFKAKAEQSYSKDFNDLKLALIYVEELFGTNYVPKTIFNLSKDVDIIKDKICPMCYKPHKSKTQLCIICNRRKISYNTSINKLLYIKEKHNTDDIWALLNKYPSLIYTKDKYKQGGIIKKEITTNNMSYQNQLSDYTKWDGNYPPYIKEIFSKYPTRKFLTLSGNKRRPFIHYLCKSCNEEHVATYDLFDKGHNCIATKSSGEIVIEEFLKQKYELKNQFDTLKCINPITGRQLPYDIEVPELNLIIEVHGEQHYEYIEYFHKSYEDFEYQKFKDNLKQNYALDMGYSYLSISYTEINDKSFKKKINSKIKEIKNI